MIWSYRFWPYNSIFIMPLLYCGREGAQATPRAASDTHRWLQIAPELQRLRSLQVRPDPYLKRPANDDERRPEANYWFYVTAICQSTRTFEGTIAGRWLRGWDYLVVATRRRLEDFTAERMLSYTAEDLMTERGNHGALTAEHVAESDGEGRHTAAKADSRRVGLCCFVPPMSVRLNLVTMSRHP